MKDFLGEAITKLRLKEGEKWGTIECSVGRMACTKQIKTVRKREKSLLDEGTERSDV